MNTVTLKGHGHRIEFTVIREQWYGAFTLFENYHHNTRLTSTGKSIECFTVTQASQEKKRKTTEKTDERHNELRAENNDEKFDKTVGNW